MAWDDESMTELSIEPDQVTRTPLHGVEDLPEWAMGLLRLVSEAAEAGETVEIHTRIQTMTPSEVAKRLGVSTSTISRRIKAGEICTIKVGNRHRIPVSEYDTFRRSMMQQMADHYADDIEADLVG